MCTQAYTAHTDALTASVALSDALPETYERRVRGSLWCGPPACLWRGGGSNNVSLLLLLSHIRVCEPLGCVRQTPFSNHSSTCFMHFSPIGSNVICVIKPIFRLIKHFYYLLSSSLSLLRGGVRRGERVVLFQARQPPRLCSFTYLVSYYSQLKKMAACGRNALVDMELWDETN